MREIFKAIEAKYRNLHEPNYSFVSKAVAQRPYEALVQSLPQKFDIIEDTTDPNDDVSFRFWLSTNEQRWILELSMVGPYGCFLRDSDKGFVFVEKNSHDPAEQFVRSILADGGIQLLPKRVLEVACLLKLSNTAPEHTKLYQALFSNVESLPWTSGLM